MGVFAWILIGLVLTGLWTVISVWFFLAHMGDKYRKSKWYDYPIMLPAGIICIIIGRLSR